MNKQPIIYMQTDPRWKDKPYRVPGETATIGGSGCGPTCAAMLIETLTGRKFTPEDACKWSMAHGYKALNQGTYYSYFPPQFAAFGIDCQQLNWTSLYGKPNDAAHDKAFELLKQGWYLIACMGPGTWTTGGHFVVVWWEDGKVRINDPASTKNARLNGDLATFKAQTKYYWAVDAREYNKEIPAEEDDDMDIERFKELWLEMRKELQDNDSSEYSDEAKRWITEEAKLFEGGGIGPDGKPNYMWEDLMTREQFATVLYRFAKEFGLV